MADNKLESGIAITFLVVGTVGFWGLIGFRCYKQGFDWLYTSTDGIIIAGIIGIVGCGLAFSSSLFPLLNEIRKRAENLQYQVPNNSLELQNWIDERLDNIDFGKDGLAEIADDIGKIKHRQKMSELEMKDIAETLEGIESQLSNLRTFR